MNFSQVLHTAQKNHANTGNRVKYYSTKYEAPKKIKKEHKQLSDNIKKFLAKKEEEERKRLKEETRKKEELLALRAQDKQATRRVNVMLKRTKSANQSVLEDAVDKTHTAVTRSGPEQPDEDDYGYVSHEASAFYEKMMEKYSKIPEEQKFNNFKKKSSVNLNSTKDRVKAALEREKEEALNPQRRKRKRKENGEENDEEYGHDITSSSSSRKDDGASDVVKSKPKPKVAAPPPLSFAELLKVAEKKQHEPILIETKPKEEERPLTKRQRKEMEREKEWKERREARYKMDKDNASEKDKNKDKSTVNNNNNNNGKVNEKPSGSILKNALKASHNTKESSINSKMNGNSSNVVRDAKNNNIRKMNGSQNDRMQNSNVSRPLGKTSTEKKLPVKDSLLKNKAKLSTVDMPQKSRQFPPPDVRRKPPAPVVVNKGRILDDSDEEYDSELDDFIDDGPLDEPDYTSAIKEIFGYDKSKYRDMDDDVDNMESSFAQQMKEEVISTKIGIMEDLEDIKLEEQHRRQKLLKKRKY